MARGTRRQFVRRTLLGFGGYLALSAGAFRPARAQPAPTSPPPAPPAPTPAGGAGRSFTPEQYRTLAVACERLLPKDEDPGATDLGCALYVERVLADPEQRALIGKPLLGGLDRLDRQARKRFGLPFATASAAQQDELLLAWQRSRFSGESTFFEVLLTLTLEGAFGDPSYGGNQGGLGFVLVGFRPPPPVP